MKSGFNSRGISDTTAIQSFSRLVGTQWAGIIRNPDESAGPLARPFARSLALGCLLYSSYPLLSLIRSFARFARSLARGTVKDWVAI